MERESSDSQALPHIRLALPPKVSVERRLTSKRHLREMRAPSARVLAVSALEPATSLEPLQQTHLSPDLLVAVTVEGRGHPDEVVERRDRDP